MRAKISGLLLAALIPLAACEAPGDETGEADLDEELETTPAAEISPEDEIGTEEIGLAQWDADADQRLTREEWGVWYDEQGLFDDWDTDAEDGLTSDELTGAAYAVWDADDDDALTEVEWNEGIGQWYGDEDYGAFGEWDVDGDSALDANEVAEGFERENLYDTVDRDSDALIDDEELADWWFDIWDADDDQLIDTTEWDQVGTEWSRIDTGL